MGWRALHWHGRGGSSGITIWDPALGKYRLRFDPAVELVRTGELEADISQHAEIRSINWKTT